MRRIACFVIPVVLLAQLVGCAQPDRAELGPLPTPLTKTRNVEPPPIVPPPREDRGPQLPRAGAYPAEWTPAGGIKAMWKTIVVHHSASNKDTPAGMNAWHLKRGWENGLGYHFVIGNGVNYPDGAVFVGPRWKRQIQGAHCATKQDGWFFGKWRPSGFFNDHGIGICLIGNFNETRPTAKQMQSLRLLTQFLCEQTGIPGGNVYGHGHITHKTECPGRNLSLAVLRQSIGGLQASSR